MGEGYQTFVAPSLPAQCRQIRVRDLAARSARVVHESFAPKIKGAGNAGCPLHPRPRVRVEKSTRVSHHRFTGSPGIPRAMVLTVSFALSPVIGLSCHRHRRNCFRQLDAGVEASGPHDFAVRKRALSSVAPPASTASRPAFVTIAKRPSVGQDGGGYRSDLGKMRTKIFLQMGMDSRTTEQPVGQISPVASM